MRFLKTPLYVGRKIQKRTRFLVLFCMSIFSPHGELCVPSARVTVSTSPLRRAKRVRARGVLFHRNRRYNPSDVFLQKRHLPLHKGGFLFVRRFKEIAEAPPDTKGVILSVA